jgi:hypothetical protein
MTTITQASPFEPKKFRLKKAFNWLETQVGLKPKPVELSFEEMGILKEDSVHYQLPNNTHVDDAKFVQEIMGLVSKSEEGTKLVDDFYKSGGRFAVTSNKNYGAIFSEKNNAIILNVSRSKSNPTFEHVKYSLASTIIHETKHAKQSLESEYNTDFANDSMKTSLMDYRLKEGDAVASQFIGAMQMATTKDNPTAFPIASFANLYSAQFETGAKALGLIEKDAKLEDVDVTKLDFSKVSKEDLEATRQDVMLSWTKNDRTTALYGDFIGKQAWMAGAMGYSTLDKDRDPEMMARGVCKTPDGKSYFTKDKNALYDEGFMKLGDACVKSVEGKIKWYESYGKDMKADDKYQAYADTFVEFKNAVKANGGKVPEAPKKVKSGLFAKLGKNNGR